METWILSILLMAWTIAGFLWYGNTPSRSSALGRFFDIVLGGPAVWLFAVMTLITAQDQ